MKWNFRVMLHDDTISLHEVFYDKAGDPIAYTMEPISFSCDAREGQDGLIKWLEMALHDAKTTVLFKESDIGESK